MFYLNFTKKIILSIFLSVFFIFNASPMESGLVSDFEGDRFELIGFLDLEIEDPTYIPENPTATAQKRARVLPGNISRRTIYEWPNLWNLRDLDSTFICNLAYERDGNGNTLLHLAMKEHVNESFSEEKKLELIRDLILEGRADLYAKNNDCDTPLHCWAMSSKASEFEALEVFKIIIERLRSDGSILDWNCLKNYVNSTPLHLVCSQGLLDCYKFITFVELGADVLAENLSNQNCYDRLIHADETIRKDKDQIFYFLFLKVQQQYPGRFNTKEEFIEYVYREYEN